MTNWRLNQLIILMISPPNTNLKTLLIAKSLYCRMKMPSPNPKVIGATLDGKLTLILLVLINVLSKSKMKTMKMKMKIFSLKTKNLVMKIL